MLLKLRQFQGIQEYIRNLILNIFIDGNKRILFFPTKAQIKRASDEPNWDGMQPK